MPNQYYKTEEFYELADRLGQSRRKVRRLIENRLFPRTRKIGQGQGKGWGYIYPSSALAELKSLVKLNAKYSDFSELRWRLWLESEGWEWLWQDLRKELLNDLTRKTNYDLDSEPDLDEIDRRVLRLCSKFSKTRRMKAPNVSSVLWAGIWLLLSGQHYPFVDKDDGTEFWRPLFRRFYGDDQADSLIETFAPWCARDKVQYILENASDYFAASVRADVTAELRLGLPRMPVRKTKKAELRQLKCLVVSCMIVRFILECSLRNNPEIQKAAIEQSYNNAVAVLVTPDGAAHGKDVSVCKKIVTESQQTRKSPP